VTTRHEFLAMLHERLKPRGYLEIGVFSGDSLRLVQPGKPAIGIDPDPHLHGHFPGTTQVYRMTSDHFFGPPLRAEDDGHGQYVLDNLDLAFIDGMHLFEYALRDFMNVELHSNRRTVVVLDDVLPRNQHEAARDQCPGDWTGDVWKVPRILQLLRPDLQVILVDTQPTGTCVVFDLDRTSHRVQDMYDQMIAWGLDQWNTVPDEVLSREEAVQPAQALEAIEFYYRGLED
jgi:hypothetical protein